MYQSAQQLTADRDIIIIMEAGTWLLREASASLPFVAVNSSGFRYNAHFAATRRLPQGGELRSGDILQVVMGREERDQTWHLGLVLSPMLATARDSRWCALASWQGADLQHDAEEIELSGRSLAQLLGVPFYRVPVAGEARITPPPPQLPALPLSFGYWSLSTLATITQNGTATQPEDGVYTFHLAGRWRRQQTLRAIWYITLALLYLGVSIATLTSELALPNAGTLLPNPALLPYIGLVTALAIAGLAIYTLLKSGRAIDRLVIDPQARHISAYQGESLAWRAPAEDIRAIYISEIIKRRGNRTIEHGEMNLHLNNDQWRFLFQQGESITSEIALTWPEPADIQKDSVRPLEADHAFTALQVAGLYLARWLGGLPVWHDLRVK